jgi:hypothetical protein
MHAGSLYCILILPGFGLISGNIFFKEDVFGKQAKTFWPRDKFLYK